MGAVVARAAIVPLLREPSLRAEQLSQLVLGETGTVEERRGEWLLVASAHDGYAGWLHGGYVIELGAEAADRWRREAAGWSLGGVLLVDGLRVRIPIRARLALEADGVRLPDGRCAGVEDGAVPLAADVEAAARRNTVQGWALQHLAGAPYEWGGVTAWGVDCSGLVQTAYAARGRAVPRDSAQQVEIGAAVPLDAICPGDLLFFRGEQGPRITHVAFAAEGERLIHSTVGCGGVVHEPWQPGTRAGTLRERLVAARRWEDG